MDKACQFPLVIVTGLSGAGKSTALNVFEDLRFFTVDGLPASLAPKLVSLFQGQGTLLHRGLALGVDVQYRGFFGDWSQALDEMKAAGADPQILFVEARTDVLVRRYATTRRPHPIEGEGYGLEQAIEEERERLAPLKHKAALVLDTTVYSIHDLRRTVQEKWSSLHEGRTRALRVHLISFGFKYGGPSEADMVFDLRFLPNPYFDEALRPLSGKDKAVDEYVLDNEPGATFINKLIEFLAYLLPLFEQEGRYRLTIAIGCTGGRHRSVAVAERIYATLKKNDYTVSLEHRHLELG